MKRISILFLLALTVLGIPAVNAQKPETVKLSQNPGLFTTTELTLKADKEYVFEVENDGVGHAVGFVIAPQGKADQANHVQSSYLGSTVKDGEKSSSGVVTLAAGEYVYFCPLNPTPQYRIVVE